MSTDTSPQQVAEGSQRPATSVAKRRGAQGVDLLSAAGTVIALIALWEVLTRAEIAPPGAIPPASTVAIEFVHLMGTEDYWVQVWNTVQTALVALGIMVLIGTVLALLVGLVKFVDHSTHFLIEFLKPIPPIVLIPLALLLWGPVPTMKVVLATYAALWPFFTQMVYGIRHTNRVALDMAASYRLGWRLTTRFIVIPSLLPYALTGLRVSASLAVIVTIVTELVGGAPGVGQAITLTQANNLIPAMYVYIITAGLLGLLVNLVFTLVERPLLFWHPSYRGEEG